jgi:hypothetical protein
VCAALLVRSTLQRLRARRACHSRVRDPDTTDALQLWIALRGRRRRHDARRSAEARSTDGVQAVHEVDDGDLCAHQAARHTPHATTWERAVPRRHAGTTSRTFAAAQHRVQPQSRLGDVVVAGLEAPHRRRVVLLQTAQQAAWRDAAHAHGRRHGASRARRCASRRDKSKCSTTGGIAAARAAVTAVAAAAQACGVFSYGCVCSTNANGSSRLGKPSRL